MLALRAEKKSYPFAQRAFYNCIGQHPMIIELATPMIIELATPYDN